MISETIQRPEIVPGAARPPAPRPKPVSAGGASAHIGSGALVYLALILGSAVMLAPLLWMVLTSLKGYSEVFEIPPRWWPRTLHWENYRIALTGFRFLRYLWNSVFVSAMTVIGTLISNAMAAYAFARLRVRGSNLLFAVLLSTTMLPAQVTIIPLFRWFAAAGMVNTYFPLILPAWLATNVFGIFLLRQFFISIPTDIVEAARIDGASEFRILTTIFLPLSKPALLTVAVFAFLGSWNDLWTPLVYLHNEDLYTLPIGLLNFMGLLDDAHGTPWHLIMAVATILIVPTVTIFFFVQRQFIEGIARSGLKS